MNQIGPWHSHFQQLTLSSKEMQPASNYFSSTIDVISSSGLAVYTPSHNNKSESKKNLPRRPQSSPSKRITKTTTKSDLQLEIKKLQNEQFPLDGDRLCKVRSIPQKELKIESKGKTSVRVFSPYKSLHRSASQRQKKTEKDIVCRIQLGSRKQKKVIEDINLQKQMKEMMLRFGQGREKLKLLEEKKRQKPIIERKKIGYVYYNRYVK